MNLNSSWKWEAVANCNLVIGCDGHFSDRKPEVMIEWGKKCLKFAVSCIETFLY